MELATLSDRYSNFYAPTFSIRLGRADLTRDLLLATSQVEVDLELGKTSRFSFTVTNCYNQKKRMFESGRGEDALELLNFGGEVDICIGYGDAKSVPIMLSGVITNITTNFPETGAPELSIEGNDHGFPLTLGKSSHSWSNELESNLVKVIASHNNLNSNVKATQERLPQIVRNQESDWEFLKKLADRNHFELFIDEKRTLHFVPPNDKATEIIRLAWGEGLLSFKPEANLAGQFSKVEVYGWDRNRKEPIVGVARAGEVSGLSGASAGQRLQRFVRVPTKLPILRLRQPVFTESEANTRAKAALNERAKQFLKGDAESVGLPEIRPDRIVFLDNLGRAFSKNYYVQQATHKVDSNGYRTRFKVKETGL
jgi:phage protein D